MKDIVLATVPQENNNYVKEFEKIVSGKYSRLTLQNLLELQTGRPIVGIVLEDALNYDRVLCLERLAGFDMQNKVWLIAEHINGKQSIGIGRKNDALEIFRENYGSSKEQYYLADVFYPPTETSRWLRPTQDFLQDTLALLQGEHKESFAGLVK